MRCARPSRISSSTQAVATRRECRPSRHGLHEVEPAQLAAVQVVVGDDDVEVPVVQELERLLAGAARPTL
jgi:transcriptional regulator NrdR family protein